VDIQWTGGDPGEKVTIQGTSVTGPTTGGGFTCTVDNNGDFVVGSDVLSLIPATIPGPTGIGLLAVSSGVRASFDAPGSDVSIILFQNGAGRSVVYK
jgi:hypothetical protein